MFDESFERLKNFGNFFSLVALIISGYLFNIFHIAMKPWLSAELPSLHTMSKSDEIWNSSDIKKITGINAFMRTHKWKVACSTGLSESLQELDDVPFFFND